MKSMCMILKCVTIFYILSIMVSGTVQAYTPNFTWKILGGVVNPEQWIFDGDMPVAMFEQRFIEQPGENLLFFDGVPKPPLLRHLKLTPDGEPLVEGVQLYWTLIHRNIITDRLVDLDIEGNGTERLKITFTTSDDCDVAQSQCVLTLTYDDDNTCYMYDFQTTLTLKSPDSFRDKNMTFEFSDPWLVGCPGAAVEFEGMWERRYDHFVYEAADGGLQSIPINHFTTSHKGGIHLKRDGVFTTLYEPDGNPAIRFMGDTAEKSGISICWWGYDLHLNRTVTPDELDSPIIAHYRIFQYPSIKAKEMAENAKMQPLGPNEWSGRKAYPIYERSSDFSKGLELDGVYKGDIDPFPWQFSGDGAVWDDTFGRGDSYCLKIGNKSAGLTRWNTFQGDGEGYFMEPWTPCKGYRISCYVKTDSVKGGGSTLAVQYHIPNRTQITPIVSAKKLKGSNDWTQLEIEVGPPPPDTGCLMIILQQDGSGTTWFDDLEVQLLQ